MTMKDTNGKYVSNNWLLSLVLFMLLTVGGFLFRDVWGQVQVLKESKLDKEQYRCDMVRIEKKIDALLDMHTKP